MSKSKGCGRCGNCAGAGRVSRVGVVYPTRTLEVLVDADLDTLATALYVTTDDLLAAHPERVPARPRVGIAPKITDAELLTLAVMQALLGYTSETGWLRYARAHLAGMFPNLPGQSGYNKRLRKLADTITWLVSALAAQTSIVDDDVWVADSTPVECARSRETVARSDLAGWALADAKADEREVFNHIVANTPALARSRPHRQVVLADKNYYGRLFEADLNASGIDLLRPTRNGEQSRPGQRFLKPLRQVIESVNDTFKGQLDLERHGGKTPVGVCARIAQRVLALVAVIWHNDRLGLPVRRSLTAYHH